MYCITRTLSSKGSLIIGQTSYPKHGVKIIHYLVFDSLLLYETAYYLRV